MSYMKRLAEKLAEGDYEMTQAERDVAQDFSASGIMKRAVAELSDNKKGAKRRAKDAIGAAYLVHGASDMVNAFFSLGSAADQKKVWELLGYSDVRAIVLETLMGFYLDDSQRHDGTLPLEGVVQALNGAAPEKGAKG